MSLVYSEEQAPASVQEINSACQELGLANPCWLTAFWALRNGAMLNDRVFIYATDLILERNQTYEIGTSFPDHVSIGDDSGGRLVLVPKSGETRFHFIDAGDPFIDDAAVFESIETLVAYVDSED